MTAPDEIFTQVYPFLHVKLAVGAPWSSLWTDVDIQPEFRMRSRLDVCAPTVSSYYSMGTAAQEARSMVNYRLFNVQRLLGVPKMEFDACWLAFQQRLAGLVSINKALSMFEAEAAMYGELPIGRPLWQRADRAILDVYIHVPGPAPVVWQIVLTLLILLGVALS